MKRKTILAFLLVLLSFSGILAQFSLSTELSYIQDVNSQQRKDLIKDNIANAEKCSNRIIEFEDGNPLASLFLMELAYSYKQIDEEELALFNILKQRVLAPNDSLSLQTEVFFRELCFENELGTTETKALWLLTETENVPQDYNMALIYFLEKSIKLYKKDISSQIIAIGQFLKIKQDYIPIWYNDWEYLTMIKIREKNKKQIIDFNKKGSLPIYKSCQDSKLTTKIYRKSIHYYIKNDKFVRAKELRTEYKQQSLSVWDHIDLLVKNIRIGLRV